MTDSILATANFPAIPVFEDNWERIFKPEYEDLGAIAPRSNLRFGIFCALAVIGVIGVILGLSGFSNEVGRTIFDDSMTAIHATWAAGLSLCALLFIYTLCKKYCSRPLALPAAEIYYGAYQVALSHLGKVDVEAVTGVIEADYQTCAQAKSDREKQSGEMSTGIDAPSGFGPPAPDHAKQKTIARENALIAKEKALNSAFTYSRSRQTHVEPHKTK